MKTLTVAFGRRHFIAMNPIEPHSIRFRPVGVCVGKRRHVSARIPLFAIGDAGVTADAGVEVYD